jgi:superfamily I DNA and/or RNA helicase
MFSATKLLGKKNIWIGDTKQLPPVVAINEDKVSKKNYDIFSGWLKSTFRHFISSYFSTYRNLPFTK